VSIGQAERVGGETNAKRDLKAVADSGKGGGGGKGKTNRVTQTRMAKRLEGEKRRLTKNACSRRDTRTPRQLRILTSIELDPAEAEELRRQTNS